MRFAAPLTRSESPETMPTLPVSSSHPRELPNTNRTKIRWNIASNPDYFVSSQHIIIRFSNLSVKQNYVAEPQYENEVGSYYTINLRTESSRSFFFRFGTLGGGRKYEHDDSETYRIAIMLARYSSSQPFRHGPI